MALDEAGVRAARRRGGATRVVRNRQSVLEAAKTLFMDIGYDDTRIETIAVAADVAVATVYNVFPGGKPTLAAAVWYQRFRTIASLTGSHYGGAPNALERIARFIRCVIDTATTHLELTNAMLTGVQRATIVAGGPPTNSNDPRLFAPLPMDLEPIISEAQRVGAIRDDVPSHVLATHITNSVLLRVMTRPKASAEESFDLLWKLLLQGIRAPECTPDQRVERGDEALVEPDETDVAQFDLLSKAVQPARAKGAIQGASKEPDGKDKDVGFAGKDELAALIPIGDDRTDAAFGPLTPSVNGPILESLTLDRSANSARAARRLVDRLEIVSEQREIIALLVMELTANAISHTEGGVELTVCADVDQIRIEASDTSRSFLPSSGAHFKAGRGLSLLDELADRWGVDARLDGKTVWFEVSTRSRRTQLSSGPAAPQTGEEGVRPPQVVLDQDPTR